MKTSLTSYNDDPATCIYCIGSTRLLQVINRPTALPPYTPSPRWFNEGAARLNSWRVWKSNLLRITMILQISTFPFFPWISSARTEVQSLHHIPYLSTPSQGSLQSLGKGSRGREEQPTKSLEWGTMFLATVVRQIANDDFNRTKTKNK